MTEEQIINLLINYYSGLFPKTCSCCGKVYQSYADFLVQTKNIGKPTSFDSEFFDGKEKIKFKFIGTQTFFNCNCGTTLVLTNKKMRFIDLIKLMYWGRNEAKIRKVSIDDLIINIRKKVHDRVLKY